MFHSIYLQIRFHFLVILLMAGTSLAQQSYVENFTTTTYRHAANTSADWNTGTGELGLFPYNPSVIGTYVTSFSAWAVTVSGNYAYVADRGSGLKIIDITDPTIPVLAGSFNTPGDAHDVFVSGNYAFVADYNAGLQVIDITDPTMPMLAGIYVTPGLASSVYVSGDLAFIADGSMGLQIIDITTPSAPTLVSTYLSSGDASGVFVDGDLVYLADGTSGLHVIDITDPSLPVWLGNYNTPSWAMDVYVSGDLAYVADYASGLQIIDVTNPGTPVLAGSYATPGFAYGVVVSGDHAYVPLYDNGLVELDISNPAAPTVYASYYSPGNTTGVHVEGNLVFTGSGSDGLRIIQVASPSPPVIQSTVSTSGAAYSVCVEGSYAYIADGYTTLQVVDISDPAAPFIAGSYDGAGNAYSIAAHNDYLFVVHFSSTGVETFDISDPTTPVSLGNFPLSGLASSPVIHGDFLYLIADGDLQVIDISNPATPVLVTTYDALGVGTKLSVSGNYLYMCHATPQFGISILDISNPAAPTYLSSYLPGWTVYPRDIVISGDHAYVAYNEKGLAVFDLSDPSILVPIYSELFQSSRKSNTIAVLGDYVLMGDQSTKIEAYDVSTPSNPVLIGDLNLPGGVNRIATSGDHAYIVNGNFQVLRVFDRDFLPTLNTAQSTQIDHLNDPIQAVRMSTIQADSVQWEISDNATFTWQVVPADNNWYFLGGTGAALFWRSTHTHTQQGINPAVSQLSIDWLYNFAAIDSIVDVPNDQGGQVRVHFRRSAKDFVGETTYPVMAYDVHRRVDTSAMQKSLLATKIASGDFVVGGMMGTKSFPEGTWEVVATVHARQQDDYIALANTLADSTDVIQYSSYLITAHTSTPSVWYTGYPDSSYSVDNLAPGAPSSVVAAYQPDSVVLDWNDAPESDFQFYRIYRGNNPGFTPLSENLIMEIAYSGWTDTITDPWGYYYKITTVDYVGNESEASSPEFVTGVQGDSAPLKTVLLGAYPNPFNPVTTLSFEMAKNGKARLSVYDVAGRLVSVLVDEPCEAGRYNVVWDGRNASGQESSSGVYLYRLETDDVVQTKRMLLMK